MSLLLTAKIAIFIAIKLFFYLMEVINPIYDTSFKYLMEDDKSAKILLSALLRKKVTNLTPRQQETVKPVERRPGDLLIYRLDYSAHLITDDGREEDVCVEIQKVWLQTELLRFRKYLASQYADDLNVQSDGRTPRHIVAIYLLGHTIAETEESVVYCHGGELTDYYGSPVRTSGGGDFVRSLTHDVVIVQIPRLPERPRNATERVLSIFDQRRAVQSDRHLIEIPDTDDEGRDVDVLRRRLSSGACTGEMRRQMQLEDEFLIELQTREEEVVIYKAEAEKQKAEAEKQKAEAEMQKAEADRQKAEGEKQKGEADRQKAEAEKQKAEAEKQKAEAEKQKAEADRQKAEAEKQKAEMLSMRRAAVMSLAKTGMPAESIAEVLGLEAAAVKAVLEGK